MLNFMQHRFEPLGWWILASWVLVTGCGASDSEVWLRLVEYDQSEPCLGGTHLHVKINSAAQKREFDEFGNFYSAYTTGLSPLHKCLFSELRFEGLTYSGNVQVVLELYDSTTTADGMITTGFSPNPFSVQEGAAAVQLQINLSRATDRKGTIILRKKPIDWDDTHGIQGLKFMVRNQSDQSIIRQGFFAIPPERLVDPFPLTISNLPIPDYNANVDIEVEAQGAGGGRLKTWTASALMGLGTGTGEPAPNPADSSFPGAGT